MATYVVGDIQGCYDGMMRLLKKLQFAPNTDRLYAVGDLVGRGPQPLEVIEYLYGLGDCFNTVLGNHDLHFLAVYAGLKPDKPKDNFAPLLASQQINNYVEWLRSRPLAITLSNQHFLSHAGLYPEWTTEQAIKYSENVCSVLQSDDWKKLLKYMYSDVGLVWSQNLSEMDELRFIIDAFTRMRYLDKNVKMDLVVKSPVDDAPAHLQPWFDHHNIKNLKSTTILFGHWASLQGTTSHEHCKALDTGYIWGGKLTAYCVETGTCTSIKHHDC